MEAPGQHRVTAGVLRGGDAELFEFLTAAAKSPLLFCRPVVSDSLRPVGHSRLTCLALAISQSLPKFTFIALVMPPWVSSHLHCLQVKSLKVKPVGAWCCAEMGAARLCAAFQGDVTAVSYPPKQGDTAPGACAVRGGGDPPCALDLDGAAAQVDGRCRQLQA